MQIKSQKWNGTRWALAFVVMWKSAAEQIREVRSEAHIAPKGAEGDRRDTEKNILESYKKIQRGKKNKKYEMWRLSTSINGRKKE